MLGALEHVFYRAQPGNSKDGSARVACSNYLYSSDERELRKVSKPDSGLQISESPDAAAPLLRFLRVQLSERNQNAKTTFRNRRCESLEDTEFVKSWSFPRHEQVVSQISGNTTTPTSLVARSATTTQSPRRSGVSCGSGARTFV